LEGPRRSNADALEPSFSVQRLFACTTRESLELLRDPIRLGFALFGTTFLMLVFDFGISTDVNNLSFAVLVGRARDFVGVSPVPVSGSAMLLLPMP
jgi:hypothetical protein